MERSNSNEICAIIYKIQQKPLRGSELRVQRGDGQASSGTSLFLPFASLLSLLSLALAAFLAAAAAALSAAFLSAWRAAADDAPGVR